MSTSIWTAGQEKSHIDLHLHPKIRTTESHKIGTKTEDQTNNVSLVLTANSRRPVCSATPNHATGTMQVDGSSLNNKEMASLNNKAQSFVSTIKNARREIATLATSLWLRLQMSRCAWTRFVSSALIVNIRSAIEAILHPLLDRTADNFMQKIIMAENSRTGTMERGNRMARELMTGTILVVPEVMAGTISAETSGTKTTAARTVHHVEGALTTAMGEMGLAQITTQITR